MNNNNNIETVNENLDFLNSKSNLSPKEGSYPIHRGDVKKVSPLPDVCWMTGVPFTYKL